MSPEDTKKIQTMTLHIKIVEHQLESMNHRFKILEVEIAKLRLDLEAKTPTPPILAPDMVTPPTEYLEKSENVINLEKDDPF